METCAKKQEVQKCESGEKIAGQESSFCSESTTCSDRKGCMKTPRKKRNEEAATSEGFERYVEEHWIERTN